MEVRLKLIERELFFCESELQSLCASNKWLGGVEGPTFLAQAINVGSAQRLFVKKRQLA